MRDITLCVIVRDEEGLLPGCLASVRDAVERIVVVDTGSRDRSAAIAREHGATLVEHPWADDFAAARNAALAHVRTRWILVLDADERLAPGAASVLRGQAARGGFECGLLPLHNATTLEAPAEAVLSGASRRGEPVLLPRFLLRTPDLAWQGIVHESLDAWILGGKRRLRRIEAPIVHYGQVPELRAARDKDARNLRLLECRVAAAPGDAGARTYLAREYERAGRTEAALVESEVAWKAMIAARESGIAADAVAPATLRAFQLLRAGRQEEARSVLAFAARVEPDHPNLNLLTGALEESLALGTHDETTRAAALARAEQALERCLARSGSVYACELLPGSTDWAAATRLGVVRLMLARPKEALHAFERALASRPAHPEAELGRLEARILLEDPSSVLPALEPRLADPTPDAWILATLACVRLGAASDERSFAHEALRRLARQPAVSPHRARWLRERVATLVEAPAPALPSRPGRPSREGTQAPIRGSSEP